MLINSAQIVKAAQAVAAEEKTDKPEALSLIAIHDEHEFVDDKSQSLTKAIGLLSAGKTTHYYSYGNFNLVRLILHILKQTGPANVFMSSYSISSESIEQLQRHIQLKKILTFKLKIGRAHV